MSDCILWTGPKAGKGYGVKSTKGKLEYVHRLSWIEANGRPIPQGMVIAHKCDTPACFNPEHLFMCTQAENLADMKRKGRSATGAKHGSRTQPQSRARGARVASAKLNDDQIKEIRATYVPGKPGNKSDFSLTGLAKKYGVAFQTISKIVNNKAWRNA